MRTALAAALASLAVASLAAAATIPGTSGPDVLHGTNAADVIDGKQGNDHISARPGADIVYCGSGNDICYGGTGRDTIYGGDGNDRIYAGCNGGCAESAHDGILNAGPGDDVIGADNGRQEEIDGRTGSDVCYVDWFDNWTSCKAVIDGSGRDLPTDTGETDTGPIPSD